MSQQLTVWILSGVTLILGYLLRHYLGPELKKIEAAIPASDLSILKELAAIVVPLVQRQFGALSGAERMTHAISLVTGWLSARGISITASEVEAAIEKAWADFTASGQSKSYPSPSPAPASTKKSPASPTSTAPAATADQPTKG